MFKIFTCIYIQTLGTNILLGQGILRQNPRCGERDDFKKQLPTDLYLTRFLTRGHK